MQFTRFFVLLLVLLPQLSYAQSSTCPTITQYLTVGSRSGQVITLKKYLISEKLLPAGLTTNYFGPATAAALKAWQKKKGIVSSGTPAKTGYGATGPRTRAALKYCRVTTQALTPETTLQKQTNTRTYSSSAQDTKMQTPQVLISRQDERSQSHTTCTSETQTRSTNCPQGHTGFITETRTAQCPDKTWSAWVETERLCQVSEAQTAPRGCTFDGMTIAHGQTLTVYTQDTATTQALCDAAKEDRQCLYGMLSGSATKRACTVSLPQSCVFNGQSVPHAGTVRAYERATVPFGEICKEESRVCTTGTLSGTYTQSACTVAQPAYSLISNVHRTDYPRVWSGWGAHLGHMLRSADGTLWFVDDSGNDVNKNPALNYFKYTAGGWQHVATQPLYGTVQQNMGSITDGQYIYSYGIDVASHRVEECYFQPTNPTYRACNLFPYDTGVASNYIGATIGPTGTRMVWWTAYTPGVDGSGTWSYIYNKGAGWQGPFTSALNGYNDYSYVYARLNANDSFEMIGNAPKPTWQTTGYDAIQAHGQLGSVATGWSVYAAPGNAVDTWIDPAGGVHTLALKTGSVMHYFYKSPTGTPANTGYTEITNGARFVSTTDTLYLLLPNTGNPDVLKYKSIPLRHISGIIPWQTLETKSVTLPPNLALTTLYPESPMYQTTPIRTVNTGINGYNTQDISMQAKVFHLEIQ